MKVNELLELIQLRCKQPEEFNSVMTNMIKVKNVEKNFDGSKIIEKSSDSYEMERRSPNISELDLYCALDEEIVMKEEECESPRRRFRSKSADISE